MSYGRQPHVKQTTVHKSFIFIASFIFFKMSQCYFRLVVEIEYNQIKMPPREKCSQCMNTFSMQRLPRKLPCCQHNICQPCIRQIVQTRQDMIMCGLCSAIVRKQSIYVFPLNTSLLMHLSEKSYEPQQPVLNQEEQNQYRGDNMLLGSQILIQQQLTQQLCPKHKVVLDIVCISDKQKICPHCALFGPHRDHRIKRLDDFQRELKEKRQVFQEIQNDKQKAFKNQSGKVGEEFRKKCQMKKGELRQKIDEEFRRFEIELKKRKELAYHELDSAFYDLQNHFKKEGPLNQFQSIRQKLNKWEHSCLDSLHRLDVTKKIEDKLYYYYEGPLEIVTEGYIYLEELNKFRDEALKKIADSIAEIKIIFDSGKSWFDKCVKVVKGKGKFSKEQDDECDVNPFLDCTSSEIVLGTNSFFNNNTSLEVDIASIPSSKKIISFDSSKKISNSPSYTRSQMKNIRSIEKERPRVQQLQPSSPQVKKVAVGSPRTANNKRPISQLSSFRSPPKTTMKSTLSNIKETMTPNNFKSKDMSFMQKDHSNVEAKQPEKLYLQFSKNTLSDFFDISDCNLESEKVVEYVHRARRIHKIRGLKIVNNRLTSAGFDKMTQYLQGVSNINAANNELNEHIFQVILKNKERLDSLKILNLTHNPIKMDLKINSKLQEVKKLGIVVTL